jgi:hypothetical protein
MANDGGFLEELVFNKFKAESVYFTEDFEIKKKYKVIKNYKVYDSLAKRKRQLDVALIKKKHGREILTAIECKDHKEKIDVQEVESFISKLVGIGANQGIMISTSGYTESALNRGNGSPGITMELLNQQELIEYMSHDYNYFNGSCIECLRKKTIWTGKQENGHVDYYSFANVITNKGKYLKIYNGRCDNCNLIQYLNRKCGAITPVLYLDSSLNYYSEKEEITCADNCGLTYCVDQDLQVTYKFKEKNATIFSQHDKNNFEQYPY